MAPEYHDTGKPLWDANLAANMIGGIVVVGMTYLDAEGNQTSQFQYHGVITEADESRGIAIECHGEIYKGQTAWLPPDQRAFLPARPGDYRLRSTGEVVRDPDYTVSYTMKKAAEDPQ